MSIIITILSGLYITHVVNDHTHTIVYTVQLHVQYSIIIIIV